MSRYCSRLVLPGMLLLGTLSGCASTLKQATKEATPTAVQASVKEVHEPANRDRLADVLADPDIRSSVSQLSQSATDGVLSALTEQQRVDKAMAASDAFVEHMNRSLARSFERELSPAIASLLATSVERSFETMKDQGPVLKDAIGAAAREAGRQAALGFQDAVAESEARQRRGEERPGQVLASVGRASDAVLRTSWVLVAAVVAALVLLVAGGFTWLTVRLRHERTRNQDLRRRLAV